MAVLTKDEASRLARIERGAQYGTTLKDLFWLLRLTRKLEKAASAFERVPAKPSLTRRAAI